MNPDNPPSKTKWREPRIPAVLPKHIDPKEVKAALRKLQRITSGLEAIEKVEIAVGITKCMALRLDIEQSLTTAAKELVEAVRIDRVTVG